MLTLVLLPGMDGTGNLFGPFITALGGACKLRIVRYPTDQALGYTELEAIARRALPTRGRFVILGESFSGPIAVSIAASPPTGLVGLILCASFVRNPRPIFAPLGAFAGFLPIQAAPAFAMRQLLLGSASTPALLAALQSAIAQVAPSAWRARIRAILGVDVSRQLAAVQVPSLYLRALQDRVVPATTARHMVQALPALQVVPIDAPHFLLQTAPGAAADAVRAFMRALDGER